ncbi:N-acetyltransferase family protein [Streptomyces boninensis]|uniref:GNAT family N-acetyltransferase n=1 Tax=Streptomyces boninensis TaxID=2039455 RepID=UPI003B20C12E
MNSDISVYVAGPHDGDAVGEVHAESWKAAYAGFFGAEFFVAAVERRRGQWHDRLAEPETTVMLAALGGKPLAFSYFGPSPADAGSAEIIGCYGHPAGWGSGIAAALMTATIDRLREGGFRRVHLWTLRDTPQSRRFYVKRGFAESGATRTYDFGDGTPVEQVEYELNLD